MSCTGQCNQGRACTCADVRSPETEFPEDLLRDLPPNTGALSPQNLPETMSLLAGAVRVGELQAERIWYRSGWRWGVLDGLCAGSALTACALKLPAWLGWVA